MTKLTVRQHQVPDFYLSQWCEPGKNAVHCYDLVEGKLFTPAPKNILASRYFYEEDPANPDNRMENHLSEMEAEASHVFRDLASLDFSDLRQDDKRGHFRRATGVLTENVSKTIKTFANYQYLRVRGAIETKRFELQPSALDAGERDYQLNPGRFVESGVAYTQERFQALRMLVCISQKEDFITSDWPCFDMQDSELAPKLGEDLGKEPGVVCYMPLNPRMAAVFYPGSFDRTAGLVSDRFAMVIAPAEVRSMNTLVIQQAEQYVVTRKPSDFVFKVAAKRKKASPTWHQRQSQG